MGNGETPILEYNNNLIPIAHNLVLPTRMPNMNDVLAGFIFKGNIEVTGCTIFDSPCGGKMCDDANNMQDGRVRAKCPCMQMTQRTGNPMISLTLKITYNAGTVITIQNFCSKFFLRTCIFKRELPPGFRADRMSNWRIRGAINSAIETFSLHGIVLVEHRSLGGQSQVCYKISWRMLARQTSMVSSPL